MGGRVGRGSHTLLHIFRARAICISARARPPFRAILLAFGAGSGIFCVFETRLNHLARKTQRSPSPGNTFSCRSCGDAMP